MRFPRISQLHWRLPASTPVRRRSAELLFGASQRPPAGTLATLGVQHAAAALTLITYVIAAATIAELSVADTQTLVAASALGMALNTALQAWGGRVGGGLLLVHIPNPMFMTLVAAAVVRHGAGALVAVTLASGLSALLVSLALPRLRTLFPPTVAGVVVCASGLTLVGPSITHAVGLDAAGRIDASSVLVSGATLAVIVACSVWGSARLKLLGLLLGVIAGLLAAGATGHLQGWQALAAAPVLALPTPPAPVLAVEPGLLVAVALIAVLSQLDTLGSAVLLHKMEDAEWRRADLKAVSRAVRANGIGDTLSALLGAFPTATSSANVALSHISRTTSRYVGLVAAALLALVAIMPQATLALTLIPTPVIGAIELYVSAFLIVSGIELIAARALDSRGIFMVGLSLTFGLSAEVLPTIARHAPRSVEFLAGNGLVIAGTCAVVINLLFRIGTSRHTQLDITDAVGQKASAITDFVETSGAAWGARRDVIARAALGALEAAEAITAAGGGRRLQAVRGTFDEYNLNLELLHSGPPLPTASVLADADLEKLLDDDRDDAVERAMANVSAVLLRNLADAVQAGVRHDQSFLRLHFDH